MLQERVRRHIYNPNHISTHSHINICSPTHTRAHTHTQERKAREQGWLSAALSVLTAPAPTESVLRQVCVCICVCVYVCVYVCVCMYVFEKRVYTLAHLPTLPHSLYHTHTHLVLQHRQRRDRLTERLPPTDLSMPGDDTHSPLCVLQVHESTREERESSTKAAKTQ
jgi:hypothetical protein